MTTFKDVAEAWIASREHGSGSLGRIQFWIEQLGHLPIDGISDDQVDDAISALVARGKLTGGISGAGKPTGQPLAGSTINRFVSTLGSIYKYARRLRVIKRSYTPPTIGIEKYPEPVDPEKYFREDEVERLIKVARVVDQKWRRLVPMILIGFHTGMRIGNVQQLTWSDINFDDGTASVSITKNGTPHISVLTERCIEELKKLPIGRGDELIFRSDRGNYPFHYQKLWQKACREAGFEGRTFHWLRHGCGSHLARAGASQAQMMQVMGHKTLTASARYIHGNVEDRKAVVGRIFK